MTTQEIIEARAPDLAAANAARIPALIVLATARTSTRLFAANYQEAIALRVLHMLVSDSRGGASGPVASEAEGGLSRSYAVQASQTDLQSTPYGQDLIRLGRAHGASMPFAYGVRV
jgi:hypothetical protein